MKTPHFTQSQIISIVAEAQAGTETSVLCRKYGIDSATLEKWLARYGDKEPDTSRRTRRVRELAGLLHKPDRQLVPISDMRVDVSDDAK